MARELKPGEFIRLKATQPQNGMTGEHMAWLIALYSDILGIPRELLQGEYSSAPQEKAVDEAAKRRLYRWMKWEQNDAR